MKPTSSRPSCEDVLNAFAVESNPGRQTLERYLKDYPQYAAELADLSRELSRVVAEDTKPLSGKDRTLIDAAWKNHLGAAPSAVTDPFDTLSIDMLREIAHTLDVPRQVITAFRERKVIVDSIPRRFLARFAATMNTKVELLTAALVLPQKHRFAGSYKADGKPEAVPRVTFERLLIDSGVPDNKRAQLMADD